MHAPLLGRHHRTLPSGTRIPPDSVKNIAESLGIPENKIDSINNAISEVTTPEEMLTLLNGEASEEVHAAHARHTT